MALFKISRGGYPNIPDSLVDGWAYFTPDNKGFYIDVVGNINGEPFNKRIKINDRVEVIDYILSASSWASNTYALTVPEDYADGTYYVEMDVIPTGGVDEQFTVISAATHANMSYTLDTGNTRVFITANGTQPTIDIPIQVKFIPLELTYIE